MFVLANWYYSTRCFDFLTFVRHTSKVITERLEPRERLSALLLYCRGLRTPSPQSADKCVHRVSVGLLDKFLADFPGEVCCQLNKVNPKSRSGSE